MDLQSSRSEYSLTFYNIFLLLFCTIYVFPVLFTIKHILLFSRLIYQFITKLTTYLFSNRLILRYKQRVFTAHLTFSAYFSHKTELFCTYSFHNRHVNMLKISECILCTYIQLLKLLILLFPLDSVEKGKFIYGYFHFPYPSASLLWLLSFQCLFPLI